MIVLVCGGRDFTDGAMVAGALSFLRPQDLLIHGGCRDRSDHKRGADWLADAAARYNGVHVAVVEALWGYYDKQGGPLRNQAMLCLRPDKVIAFPGGRGTENCIRQAEEAGIPVERAGEGK